MASAGEQRVLRGIACGNRSGSNAPAGERQRARLVNASGMSESELSLEF
jgi:hypothetical protein